ncbi:hypothetical protein WOSG25_070140 [Weissella oryzae SG25]|uniref:Uncharacterized protein n=1 Tax=Weissella oryzae (strain DSM 25784 / JCM 18191 / LMG 30913 / SG25) TaxID=1329250 RepID=A0A069CUF9_WEIOS|nr:hypothetical protein WOSG25_070140 [Weissella oryzae SG25]
MINTFFQALTQSGQDGAFLFLLLLSIAILSFYVLFKLFKYLFILIGRDLYIRHLRKHGRKFIIR